MGIEKGIFNRTSLLLGDDVMESIYQKRVIIFGLGGVGSWCAESLVRSGIKELVLVDSDRVCVTNVNRQLMATTKTVGQVKVEVLKNRLLEINPHANIVALQDIYEEAIFVFYRARDGTRTRDPDLGKVVLHQLSHSRIFTWLRQQQ